MVRVRVVVLGCGSSTATPTLNCLAKPRRADAQLAHLSGQQADHCCKVCAAASGNPLSKNRRGNPSLLISLPGSPAPVPAPKEAAEAAEVAGPADEQQQQQQQEHVEHKAAAAEPALDTHLLVDCGKTFRDAVERFFARLDVRHISGLVLTHDHADCLLGIDDIRDVQKHNFMRDEATGRIVRKSSDPLPVFANAQTAASLRRIFPYIFDVPPPPKHIDLSGTGTDAAGNPIRYVANLELEEIGGDAAADGLPAAFGALGLRMQPVELIHGKGYISYGYIFGPEHARFAYLSDLSEVPAATMAYLKSLTIETLVLDAVFVQRHHNTHMNLPQALALARELRAARCLLVGMTHEFDYDTLNEQLRGLKASEGLAVEMAYDGLEMEFDWDAADAACFTPRP